MFEFLTNLFSSLDNFQLFFYVPCCALVFGLVGLILSFSKRGFNL